MTKDENEVRKDDDDDDDVRRTNVEKSNRDIHIRKDRRHWRDQSPFDRYHRHYRPSILSLLNGLPKDQGRCSNQS